MNKKVVIVAVILIGLGVLASIYATDGTSVVDDSGLESDTATTVTPTATSSPVRAEQTSVKVYLIDIEGTTTPGPVIGCGDHVVGVPKNIPQTQGVLKAALEQLLAIKDQKVFVGELEYYNALYQSNLTLESVTIENGVADVRLTGTMQSGGICDDPRIIAQLTKTVEQFPTVKSSKIFINNVTLEEYFSQR